jgi:hypothetical protein
MFRVVAAIFALVLLHDVAIANPFEVIGLTSRRAGQANTGVASADDVSALYYNPAGLVLTPGPELALGTIGAYAHLESAGKLPDPVGGQLAMRTPLPLRGPLADRIVIGIALHLLPRDVAHVIAPAPDKPFYPYYGDRMSRIVVLPGAAVRLGRWSVGVSIDVLANLGGALSASEGATRSLDVSGDQRIGTIARAIVGGTWQATPCLRLGAAFHQRFELPFETAAVTTIAGEPLDLAVKAAGQFSPHQLVVGGAWTRGRHLVSFDAKYARWSDYRGPYVRLDSTLPLVGEVPALAIDVPFEDTFGGRVSIESRVGRAWIVRGGYGFETSPVPAKQTGVTNLLDGPRHTFAFGLGRMWGRFRVDAHVSMQVVQSRTIEKELDNGLGEYDPYKTLRDEDTMTNGLQISNPGFPNISSGGQVLSGGVTVEVRL